MGVLRGHLIYINYTISNIAPKYRGLQPMNWRYRCEEAKKREGYLGSTLSTLAPHALLIDLSLEELPPRSSAYGTEPRATDRRIMTL